MAERRWGILALLGAVATAYILYPGRTLECDAVIYASHALRGVREMTFNAGHLGYGPLEALITSLARGAVPPMSPIPALGAFSAAAGLVGLYAFYRLLRESGVADARALAGTAILAATYGYWHFALQALPNMPSTALLLVFLWRFARALRAPSSSAAGWAGAWLGLATLMFQRDILLLGAALAGIAVAAREDRRWLRLVLVFLAVYGVVVVTPYLLAAGLAHGIRTGPELMRWVLGIVGEPGVGHWTPRTLPAAGIGVVRSLVGSHFLLGFGSVRALADRLFYDASLEDEFAVAATVPAGLRVVLAMLEAGVLLMAGFALARRVLALPALASKHTPLVVTLLVWGASIAVFAAWWTPVRSEMWLDLFPPLVALQALPVPGVARPESRWRAFAVFGAMLVAVNLLGSIRPQSLPGIDPEARIAAVLEATVRPGDAVVSDLPFATRASYYALGFERAALPGIGVPMATTPREATYRALDSLLAAVAATGREVFVVTSPLAPDTTLHAPYRDFVASLGGRYQVGNPVPNRAGVELRRIRR